MRYYILEYDTSNKFEFIEESSYPECCMTFIGQVEKLTVLLK